MSDIQKNVGDTVVQNRRKTSAIDCHGNQIDAKQSGYHPYGMDYAPILPMGAGNQYAYERNNGRQEDWQETHPYARERNSALQVRQISHKEAVYYLTNSADYKCTAAAILRFLAVLTWIGGLATLILLIISDSSVHTKFLSSSIALLIFIGCFFLGLVHWAIAALCEDIHVTRSCLETMKLERVAMDEETISSNQVSNPWGD